MPSIPSRLSALLLASLPLARAAPLATTYPVEMLSVDFVSFDGVKLPVRVALPRVEASSSLTFPAVLMANSWDCPDIEYAGAQHAWASAGYVVLEYEARGWFSAGGVVSLGGAEDMADVSALLDLLTRRAAEWHVDVRRFAAAGISYGAGLAVLGAAHDARLSAAVSMSGWGNLTTAFFFDAAPNRVWAELLISSGKRLGRMPPELDSIWRDCDTATNISAVVAWADQRSPEAFLQTLAQRDVPIFISNNFEDRLFMPDAAMQYRQALHGAGIRTHLMLNQGVHASAEIPGAFGLKNVIFDRAREWLDQQLKGGPAPTTSSIELEARPHGVFSSATRIAFDSWPSAQIATRRFTMSGRGSGHWGGLSESSPPPTSSDSIRFGKTSGLSAGTPVLSEALQALARVPILSSLPLVDTTYATVYLSDPLPSDWRICGTPNVTLSATPSDTSYQLVAYLFDVEPFLSVGTLLSHAGYNVWHTASPGSAQLVHMRMRTLCVDVPKGHRLGLGIDMFTELLTPANSAASLTVLINYDGGGSQLELPLYTAASSPR